MYLGIDFGKKRIGLALGKLYPKGIGVVNVDGDIDKVLDIISKTICENEVTNIVIGLPIRSMGEEGTIAKEIREFAQKLSKMTNLPVNFEPEQFTSTAAEAELKERASKKGFDRGQIDELAAVLILEQFINHLQDEKEIKPDINPKDL